MSDQEFQDNDPISVTSKSNSKGNLYTTDDEISEENSFISSSDEKEAMPDTSNIGSINIVTNLLWHGVIFENVQSLRHFRDSKSFIDHVLKTTELRTVNDYFVDNILNHSSKSNRKRCKIHRSLSDDISSNVNTLQHQQLINDNDLDIYTVLKRSSFPRASTNNKYHSVMDEFINTFFFRPGFELLAGETPSDWSDHPNTALFTKILVPKNDDDANTTFLHYFARELNRLWKTLYREVNKNVSTQTYRYTFISLKHPGIFVPGGRFREIYYWDTFWIIQGLLCCGMIQSSIKLVENLADLVDRFGFVPNGTRKYYLDRSQPPLLTLMTNEVYTVTKDTKWLKSILPSLIKEYEYWTTAPIQVSLYSETDTNKQYNFARYYTYNTTPRPESYYEDRFSTIVLDDPHTKGIIYQNIRATAASGWDFSSRWYYDENGAYGDSKIASKTVSFVMNASESNSEDHLIQFIDHASLNIDTAMSESATSENEEIFDEFAQKRMQFKHNFSMTKLDTIHVIPVDLNVFLCKVEGCLSKFSAEVGNQGDAVKFKSYQNARVEGILAVLWDEDHKQFRDWNFRYKCFGNLNIASNFFALWLSCDHNLFNEKKLLLAESLRKSNLICDGGIVMTLYETGEQWDYPNCWAPINHMIIEGLYNMGQIEYALELANIWMNNTYYTFLSTNKMHEKYHCDRYGTGGGGEYKPQIGFGWTNGVCLKLMELFGSNISLM